MSINATSTNVVTRHGVYTTYASRHSSLPDASRLDDLADLAFILDCFDLFTSEVLMLSLHQHKIAYLVGYTQYGK